MNNIGPAIIIAIGLAVGGFLAGGRYSLVPTNAGSVARLDRYTGAVVKCIPGTRSECDWMLDQSPSETGWVVRGQEKREMDEIENVARETAAEIANSN